MPIWIDPDTPALLYSTSSGTRSVLVLESLGAGIRNIATPFGAIFFCHFRRHYGQTADLFVSLP